MELQSTNTDIWWRCFARNIGALMEGYEHDGCHNIAVYVERLCSFHENSQGGLQYFHEWSHAAQHQLTSLLQWSNSAFQAILARIWLFWQYKLMIPLCLSQLDRLKHQIKCKWLKIVCMHDFEDLLRSSWVSHQGPTRAPPVMFQNLAGCQPPS
jgi:hypothetical protein